MDGAFSVAVGAKPGIELNSIRRRGYGSLTGCSPGLGFDEAIDSTPDKRMSSRKLARREKRVAENAVSIAKERYRR